MYELFYGLKEKPFNLLPDPDYLYMSAGHENVFHHLEYAILENKGFVVITGEIGSGKTTLINFLLQKIPQDVQVAIFNNTDLDPHEFIKMACQEFELNVDGLDKVEMLDRLQQFLVEQYAARKRVVLIVDEAQNLIRRTLEEIRMLSNLETEKHHLLQIILVGQPELIHKLRSKDLEQFLQRVTVHAHLEALSPEDVGRYVRYRLEVAGATRLDLFTGEAVELIYTHSRGIPRLINILCDTALVYGYADELTVIGPETIQAVVASHRILGGLSGKAAAEPAALPERQEEPATRVLSKVLGRLKNQEMRILRLEAGSEQLERRLVETEKHRGKREILLVELLHLLRKTMEGHRALIDRHFELQQELSRREKSPGERQKPPRRLFPFSRR
jgi:general secretion pathway protein A